VSAADAEFEFLAPRHDIPAGGRSGFMAAEERQIHYLEWGRSAAQPVVCLHGGGQTAYMWEELGTALASTHHVFAPDLPGHGDTDPIDEMDRRSLAATIPPLLDQFGIERAAFVGASLGGIVSLTLAADRPDLVASIALIDIGHRLEDEGVNRIIDFMTKHESFSSPEEAAVEVAEYLPHRRQVNADNLRRNLRELPDGRWVWKHMFAAAFAGRGPRWVAGASSWPAWVTRPRRSRVRCSCCGARRVTCSRTRAPRRSLPSSRTPASRPSGAPGTTPPATTPRRPSTSCGASWPRPAGERWVQPVVQGRRFGPDRHIVPGPALTGIRGA
jgi:pimeloyl-ACP methyl ester carboxylesterase